jgi:hypothetical protein
MCQSHLRMRTVYSLSELTKAPAVEAVSEPDTEAPSVGGFFSDSDGEFDLALEQHAGSMAAERWCRVGERLSRVFADADPDDDDDELPATASAVRAGNWHQVAQRLHGVFAAAVSEAEEPGEHCGFSQAQRWMHVGERIGAVFADTAVDADADW